MRGIQGGTIDPATLSLKDWLFASGLYLLAEKRVDLLSNIPIEGCAFQLHHCIADMEFFGIDMETKH